MIPFREPYSTAVRVRPNGSPTAAKNTSATRKAAANCSLTCTTIQTSAATWRGLLVEELTGREEGFVADGALVVGRSQGPTLERAGERLARWGGVCIGPDGRPQLHADGKVLKRPRFSPYDLG